MPPRKKQNQPRTLVFFLKSLVGTRVVVELRNETEMQGVVETVDDMMGIYLINAEIRRPGKPKHELDRVFANGSHIRYVRLPASVNVGESMERHAKKQINARASFSRARKPKLKRFAGK